jgi:hypothetical protein
MKSKRSVILVVALSAVLGATVATNSLGAGGTGAVASFTKGTLVPIQFSQSTTPASSWQTVGKVALPVGSWVIDAHAVAVLAGTAPQGTIVECDLVAPNAQLGYTATGVLPTKGNNVRELSAQTVSDAPNGGTAILTCRVNTKVDSKLAVAKQASIVATSVSGTSTSLNKL